jgi:hypothetical protein
VVNLMPGMIAQLLAWPTLGIALLVFGFAPGVAMRLIVLFYRRGNPRRQELLGELYAVPRIERPFWVVEQLEVAIFEGLRDRFKAWLNRAATRIGHQLTGTQLFKREFERQLAPQRSSFELRDRTIQLASSDDPFASLLAGDVSRGWRGRGWRGAQPDVPPKEDHVPPAEV